MSVDYLTFKGKDQLMMLERVGSLRLLVVLLQGKMHVSKIIKRDSEDPGIATQNAMKKTRDNLVALGLITENEETVSLTGTRRIYIQLTEKGRVVAEIVKNLAENL